MINRYVYILCCFLFSLLSWSQDCLESISIPSGSYQLFDDYLNQVDEDIILLPITTTGEGDVSVSSYQFNLIYNHSSVNIDLESFDIVNNANFYNLYDLQSTISNTDNGGYFSVNSIQVDENSSMLSVAYATNQVEALGEKLLYIPLIVSNEACFELSFSDGFINDQYVFLNQTHELLISNQNLSECTIDGVICLSSGNSVDQCADVFACNYNANSNTDEGCVYLSEPIVDITQGTWEMNYYWSINDMDYVSTYDFVSNASTLEGVLDPDWAAATGSSDSFYWSMCGSTFTMWYIQDLSVNPYYNGDIVFVGTYCNGVITGTSSAFNGNTGTFTMTNSIIAVLDGDCDGSEVYGCTDPSAFNYNEDATDDDGSCISIVYGCTDEVACNYNNEANSEDDSCIFEGDSCFMVVNSDCCCCGVCDCVCEQAIESPFICEGDLTGDYSEANIVIEGQIENCECTVNEVTGCTDMSACNYDINATDDDGSCEYLSCVGCTDLTACNYNPDATDDDGSCVFNGESCYVVVGNDCCCCGLCLCVCEEFVDPMYTCEFLITGEDSNNIVIEGQWENCECNTSIIEGCTDEAACNYNNNANTDDGSCEYVSVVDLGEDVTTCEEFFILDAGTGYDSYSWSTGETSSSIVITESGDYSVDVTSQNCPLELEGFYFLGTFNGSDYYGSENQLNWTEANSLCNSLGGHLLVVESEPENNFIVDILSPLDMSFSPSIWIGLFQNINSENYSEPNGGWEWVNGAPLDYVNWNGFLEPNNAGSSEEYGNLWINSPNTGEVQGTWNDWSNDASWWNSADGTIELGALPFVLELSECTMSSCIASDTINVELNIDACFDLLACNYNPDNICEANNDSCIYPDSCENCEDVLLTHSIDLPLGWSLFSTYICPFDANMASVMLEAVDNNLVIVKDENGNVYWPEYNLNTIGELVNGKGYLVKTENEMVLNIYGSLLNYDIPINLNDGWSYLGYLHQQSFFIEDMMSNIVDNVTIVKNDNGDVYWPMFDLNMIGEMYPGEGYQIKTNQSIDFQYPSGGRFGLGDFTFIENPVYYPMPLNTGNNMTIGFPTTAWEVMPAIGDEIAAYDESGRLIGSTIFTGEHIALTVWGDDLITKIKDGVQVGEKINFTLWSSELKTESLIVVGKWDTGSDLYSIDGISIASNINFITNNLSKQIVKVFDVLGRETDKGGWNIELYNDGSVNRKYIIE